VTGFAGVARWVEPTEVDPRRPLRLGLSVFGLIMLLGTFVPPHGYDLLAYWQLDLSAPYAGFAVEQGRFQYAPPIALLMAPLGALPWDAVIALWLALQLAALWYIGREWALALIVFPPVWLDMVYGNINIFIAAAIVAAFRYPAAWAFPLLTKVTPGVGALWFLGRREWRSLLIAFGVTATIAAASVLILGPGIWTDWFEALRAAQQLPARPDALNIPLALRVTLAAVLVVIGGARSWRWSVPVAATLAMPTLFAISFAPLVALAPDLLPIRSRRPAQEAG
jgi:hypothetical protein